MKEKKKKNKKDKKTELLNEIDEIEKNLDELDISSDSAADDLLKIADSLLNQVNKLDNNRRK